MNPVPSPDLAQGRGSFAEDGHAIVESLFAQPDLALLAELVERRLAQPHDPGMNRVGNDLVPLRWNDPIVLALLTRHAALARIAEAAVATDLRWISAYISSKPAHSPALPWHQDWWAWDHPVSFAPHAPQIAVVCYLSATSARSGALRVLPGSQHAGHRLQRMLPEPHSIAADQLPPDHPALGDAPGQATLAVAPGDAVVIDYRLLHGTHPNHAASRRDALLFTFAPHWRALPDEVRAHLAMHPALPTRAELQQCLGHGITHVPTYDGAPRSLQVNRVAPVKGFATRIA